MKTLLIMNKGRLSLVEMTECRYFVGSRKLFQTDGYEKFTTASPIVNANASTLTTPLNFTTTTRFGIKSQASKDARTITEQPVL